MNCIIVDDEPLAQEILEGYIKGSGRLNLIKKCSTASEAFEALHLHKIDVVFLDIKMPGINGIDFLKSLNKPPKVIFTTAYSEYAAESYNLEAVDYMLKPITVDRFEKCIEKLFKLQRTTNVDQPPFTYFKVSGNLLKVLHTELYFGQSIKDYLLLNTAKGNFIVHMTMKYIAELLPSNQFFRIHRSYFVNRSFVEAIGKNYVLVNGLKLPIGDKYKDLLIAEFSTNKKILSP